MSDPRSGRGRVVLLGAGPGDPELVTLRGMNALRAADVVIFDALAPQALLDWIPPHAERLNVGRRGHDVPTLPQPEIIALILDRARAGKVVVRLKGGDPFVFGRGGEEASACVEAGIDFEVIPGVSSVVGAPAYAGIPLTDRRHAASFAVVTGHKDPTKVAEATRWEALAVAVDTLVIVMGMRNLPDIAARLLEGGRDPKTPAAIVMNGTLPEQRVLVTSLDQLAARAEAEGFAAPSVIVVGEVVRLRESLRWFEQRPLLGRRVWVTRDEGPNGRLSQALRAVGAEPVLAPSVRIAAPADWSAVDGALAARDDYDGLLLTSANAARYLHRRASERGISLADARWRVWCVGPQTAEVAAAEGFAVDRVPPARFDAEGLLEILAAEDAPAGKRYLFPCAADAAATLSDGLRALGARVDRAVCYRSVPADPPAAALAALRAGDVDALTFTSPAAARNFAERLDEDSRKAAERTIVACIGPVTADALRAVGLPPAVVAARASMPELAAALVAHFARNPGGNP